MMMAEVLDDGRRVRVPLPGGETRNLSVRWLFDHGWGARDPVSGQRRHGALVMEDVATGANIDGDELVVTFAAGERRLPLARLWAPETRAPDLWLTPKRIATLDPVPFDAYLHDDDALEAALRRVVQDGLVLLDGAGADPGATERAVARLGFVRETNYGRLFDVRAEAQPRNLAFTERALELHTDNPYRDPVPTLQILHAITVEDEGGETVFADGFAHAEALRRDLPTAFDLLAREPVRFTYTEASGARWSTDYPVLEANGHGALRAVRLNHRALDLAPRDPAAQDAWYDAYLAFYHRVHAPEAAYARKLAAGEIVIFDNRRLLHGRRAYRRGGARWLRGAYADIDGLRATLARLQASPAGPADPHRLPAGE